MFMRFEQIADAIQNALLSIDKVIFGELINQAVCTLQNNNKIIVSGLGKNVAVCEKFVGTMVSLGLNAVFMNTNSASHGDIGMVKENDLVIVLTKSGETIESIYLVELLQLRKNINIWLITFNSDSTLSNKITNKLVINLKHEGDKWNILPNNSTTINLIVLQELAMQLSIKMDIDLESFRQNHPAGHIGAILNNGK
ncbi:sugar isomerase [Candidatus Epulonipiscium fishelsonii]|uniref:Sugar isomerase n=1 Tax=Candidatus Epulonipiscium fishelsonii TaxID=77094 RepID=A0ACC8XDM1_9FIRM|nr:sugar isomerase [Epulopiscium sp. SCG-B11WGA-EpuloA1]